MISACCRNVSSACLRSWMSVVVPYHPTICPPSSRAGEKPAVLAVVAAVTDFNLVVCALHQRLGPLRHAALVVIGVNDQSRPIARELFGRQAAIREPLIGD